MSPRIVRIEDAGPERRARRLVFDDGSPPRITSATVAKELRLEEGLDLPMAGLEAALAQAEPIRAKERALRLLRYRERSVAELARKLEGSGYDVALATAIVAHCQELGLVDDERFAEMWVHSRNATGHGARRIRQELAQKGVAPTVISAALERECPADQEFDRAQACLRGQRAQNPKDRERLARRLVSRGFDLATALRAVDEPCDGPDGDVDGSTSLPTAGST
jgi:regulatory protein